VVFDLSRGLLDLSFESLILVLVHVHVHVRLPSRRPPRPPSFLLSLLPTSFAFTLTLTLVLHPRLPYSPHATTTLLIETSAAEKRFNKSPTTPLSLLRPCLLRKHSRITLFFFPKFIRKVVVRSSFGVPRPARSCLFGVVRVVRVGRID
jgi:hypothetical protein